MAHTPGEWRVGDTSPPEEGPQEIAVLADNPRAPAVPYCVAVAIPFGFPQDLDPQMTRDNARLIAAAPELLESVRALLVLHEAHHNDPVHAAAREAIRRAIGSA